MPVSSIPVSSLGVVIVTFNAADVILDCLESLLAAQDVQLDIAVIDNASTDGTVALLQDWAAGRQVYQAAPDIPFALAPCAKPVALDGRAAAMPHRITLIETGVNGGFAAGVNYGIAHLMARPGLDRFWVLNPDSVVPPGTALAFAKAPAGDFALMGGRVLYLDGTGTIQIDGGTVDWRSGVTGNVHLGLPHATTPAPDPAGFDFIMGASMVASRPFISAVGPMREDYFLYYEEVDWALRRAARPLAYCADGIIYHRAGTAIGSPTLGRPASAFSLYFKHRGRLRFMRRFRRRGLPGAYAYALLKALQLLIKGYPAEAWTIVIASLDGPPPAAVRARLSPDAAAIAFARPEK